MKVIAMVLAYNCEKMFPRTYARIPRDLVDDIIVMDDASRDGTSRIAREYGLKVFRNEKNRGYGGNAKAGLKKALELGADYVVEVHGDSAQYDPSALKAALPYMRDGVDFILGSRFQEPRRALQNGMPMIRFVANRFLSFFDRRVLDLPLTEFHTGFRVYSRRMIETLPIDAAAEDYLFSFQVIAQAAYYKLRVAEVPVEADYINDHTSASLPRSSKYAVETFIELGKFVLAKKKIQYSPVYPCLH